MGIAIYGLILVSIAAVGAMVIVNRQICLSNEAIQKQTLQFLAGQDTIIGGSTQGIEELKANIRFKELEVQEKQAELKGKHVIANYLEKVRHANQNGTPIPGGMSPEAIEG